MKRQNFSRFKTPLRHLNGIAKNDGSGVISVLRFISGHLLFPSQTKIQTVTEIKHGIFRLKNLTCWLRLCKADKTVHEGLTEIATEKKNKPPMYQLLTIKECDLCGRQVVEPWSESRRQQFRKDHADLYQA